MESSVGRWVKAIAVGALEPDDADKIDHEGTCIAIFNLQGEFFATGGICTHEHAFLSEGYVDGETVECPLHQGLFNIRTGQPLSPPVTEGLRTYRTRVEDDFVWVLIDEETS
ncbi:MAG: MocE family 2Fe-2S type ferredoxin [Rhodospirillales bacterium]